MAGGTEIENSAFGAIPGGAAGAVGDADKLVRKSL